MSSRELLLNAARELFTERGFDRTTTRDLGEKAGVDAALIARHFGSKAGLYLASLRTTEDGPPPDLRSPGRARALLERYDRGGPGPVLQAAVRRHEQPEVQAGAEHELHRRLVEPLLAATEGPGAELRVQVAVAAFAGIALARTAGSLPAVADADVDVLVELVDDLLGVLVPVRPPGSQR